MGTDHFREQSQKLAIAAVVFLLPLRALSIPGMGGATPGLILALLLIPVIWSSAGRYRIGWPIGLSLAALVSVPVLLEIAKVDHKIDDGAALGYVVILVGALVTYLSLLWSRKEFGVRTTALLYSGGWILQQAMSSASWSTNAWKYAFAWPVTVFVAALIYNNRSRFLSLSLVGVMAAMSILNDYRSNFGLLVVTGLIILWLWNRGDHNSRVKTGGILVGLGVVFWGVYQAGIWLALDGYLGVRNQLITAQQLSRGESLLASGRIETSAAWNLLLNRPIGYGPGVVPNTEDVLVAKSALQATGVNLDSTYVNTYVVGQQIKLHSVASDLWVSFGIAGLVLAAYFAWLLLTRLVTSQKQISVLYVFASVVALWDIGFSPISSNIHEVIFAAALATPLLTEPKAFKSNAAAKLNMSV
ncbi:hypothetical protein NIBR502772_19375 [Pseudarthrobacter sp. NIBRBAC000502772]|uniref:hypothetical protein n=1 Tax=Pseudarthrobacter sp. NIBRBAC000502772 TaxID=2590775 RepID=UPI00113235A1|nr:hypothetical protein [Pseudarthrobacter sp. NIBRBAC000502772]QDG68079.1 hypothetical protein NIBR502772_19375 [Pseudarthrobacter sp. NIBRBAC000502772]